jgi:hypothetical protein
VKVALLFALHSGRDLHYVFFSVYLCYLDRFLVTKSAILFFWERNG